ncbi:MAG: hypothetical protein Q4F24_11195, partial [Eubacteriales bacterium]|nr:hypothetical protein [Eubacteriales bacterium]
MAYASESGSWTYDGETYDHRILIYDSNAANGKNIPVLNPIWNEDYCLYFNEGTNEWIIPAYATYIDDDTKEIFPCMTSTNSNASLYNACNELDKLDIKNYNAGFYNYVAELRCQNETAMRLENGTKQYVIMGNSGSADGLTTYYEAETISNRSNPGTLHVILPDDSEEYVISTLSGNAEELDFNIMYKDKFISIAASSADGAQFSPNGVLKLIGNEEDFKIIIADDEISDGKFDTYTFTGGNTGDITVNVTNEEVFAEGENLRGLKIEASEKDIITTLEIENDSSDVRIEQEGTTLTPIET